MSSPQAVIKLVGQTDEEHAIKETSFHPEFAAAEEDWHWKPAGQPEQWVGRREDHWNLKPIV